MPPSFLDDLRAKGPDVRGSVQNLYRVPHNGRDALIAEATDAGSAFDVGTYFSVPGSGRSRTELRHTVFTRLGSPAAWQALTRTDFASCCTAEETDRRWNSPLLAKLRTEGAPTHHLGLVDERTGKVTDTWVPTPAVMVEEYPVIKPVHFADHGRSAWDYHNYQVADRKLIDLEHIFRLGSPAGSSIEHRYRAAVGSEDPEAAEQLLQTLGLELPVVAWGRFDTLLYDCSTKFEDHDRYLDWQESVHVSGLDHSLLLRVIDQLASCTIMVNRIFGELGFILWDIKWEVAVDGDRIVVVDTVDHDSIRITSDELIDGRRCFSQFNKQAVRDHYRILFPEWISALDDAKHLAESDASARTFRAIYDAGVTRGAYPPIPELDPDFAQIQSEKYELVAVGASGRRPLTSGGDVRTIVESEIRYYAERGRDAEFLSHISTGT